MLRINSLVRSLPRNFRHASRTVKIVSFTPLRWPSPSASVLRCVRVTCALTHIARSGGGVQLRVIRMNFSSKSICCALSLVVLALGSGIAAAEQDACLPMSLFPQEQDAVPPAIDLGLVRGAPVLCAHGNYETGGLIGCWSIDVAAGKMSKVASTPPPGHSVRSTTDANGCVEGYCADPKPEAGENVLWAKNTTGDRVAFVHSYTLHVFDASSKAQLGTVPLSEENAPGNTNVGNEPIELLYVGRTIFVL
ncbi:MAG: hypothetical protein AB7L18_11960, partial [Hyphomicrobiaceae bacterium]